MENLPNDPNILLSYVNMKLRNEGVSFEELCAMLGVDIQIVEDKLNRAGFFYDRSNNRFI